MKIKVAGTVNDSIVDGPGIRYTIFTQGCSHKCPGCHNPQTHDPEGGQLRDIEDIFGEVKANPLLRGITLSGGEPFEQPVPCIELVKRCKTIGLDIWAYTGYLFEEIYEGKLGQAACDLLCLCDVIVDGSYMQDLKTLGLRFRGSSNQRIIDVEKTLENKSIVEIEL